MLLLGFPFRKFFARLYERAFDEDIFSSTAQVAFYFSFAIFPMLLFLVSIFGLVVSSADGLRLELFMYLRQIMPNSAYQLLKNTIDEVSANTSGSKITLGFFVALWSASTGVDGLRIALNSVFGLKDKRAWWKTTILSIFFTLIITALISIALAIVFYGWKFILVVLALLSLPQPEGLVLVAIQWIGVSLLLLILFDLLYNFLPDHSPFRWVWITPGAVIGIILWLILTTGFREYLSYFNTYTRMYGTLGAVMILMLWLYLTSLVILVGGLINSILFEFHAANEGLSDEVGDQLNKQIEIESNHL